MRFRIIFDRKRIKDTENAAFELSSLIEDQIKTIAKNKIKILTNKSYYVSYQNRL